MTPDDVLWIKAFILLIYSRVIILGDDVSMFDLVLSVAAAVLAVGFILISLFN